MRPPGQAPSPGSVVAVGSSAGGLAALRTILGTLPRDFPGAVVVVQQRAPRHDSVLADLLGRHTALEVRDATDGERLRSGVVYLAPPDRHLIVGNGWLHLSDAPRVNFSRPSLDVLFQSVATVYGRHAVGVILSAGGVDGARGLQAIRHAGGRTVVQAPADTKVPGMPLPAIAGNGIVFVPGLADIGPLLADLGRVTVRRRRAVL